MRNEELAAVWVPCGLTNAGDNFETFSIVESPLMPFSVTGINKRERENEKGGMIGIDKRERK